MFDSALNLLGPDDELLFEMLNQLGKRHVSYGVTPHYLPFMGRALILALSDFLGKENWSDKLEDAWYEVYCRMSGVMMQAILDERPSA